MYCAPNIDVSSHYTCFEYEELVEIAEAFNRYIQKSKVCGNGECVPKTPIKIDKKNKQQLWKLIYNKLSKICKYEFCWLDLKFINMIPDEDLRDKIKLFTFKPKTTRGQRSWLNTQNINDVMLQYARYHNLSFKFIGALPCDFYKKVHVDYSELEKHKRIGFVLNLDTHDMPGSHWVALLVDNVSKTCEYFDSTGGGPNGYIQKFINKLMSHLLRQPGPRVSYLQNNIVHQKKNGECGVYSLYFLIQRLRGKSFQDIVSHVIRDDDMNMFRNYIFRPRKA